MKIKNFFVKNRKLLVTLATCALMCVVFTVCAFADGTSSGTIQDPTSIVSGPIGQIVGYVLAGFGIVAASALGIVAAKWGVKQLVGFFKGLAGR